MNKRRCALVCISYGATKLTCDLVCGFQPRELNRLLFREERQHCFCVFLNVV